jgi:hypothetical protein
VFHCVICKTTSIDILLKNCERATYKHHCTVSRPAIKQVATKFHAATVLHHLPRRSSSCCTTEGSASVLVSPSESSSLHMFTYMRQQCACSVYHTSTRYVICCTVSMLYQDTTVRKLILCINSMQCKARAFKVELHCVDSRFSKSFMNQYPETPS